MIYTKHIHSNINQDISESKVYENRALVLEIELFWGIMNNSA